jgi:hypothetical protein
VTSEPDPWRAYSKMRLGAGYTHPVGQQGLRAALVASKTAVDWLSLSDCVASAWREERPVRLLSIRRVGDVVVREWGNWPLGYQTHLSVNACPSRSKALVRSVVLEEALPRAAAWLRESAGRGDAWRASEHQLEALWDHPGVRYVEDRFR